MRRPLLSLLIVGVGLAAAAAPAIPQPLPHPIDDTEGTCSITSMSPSAAYVPVVDSGDEITVDLFLVGDRGISEYRMTELVRRAQRAYTPLNMKLRVVGSEQVAFSGTDARELIEQTKTLFPDGERPSGVDAVMTFTSVEMTSGLLGGSVAGMADCVGGIEFPTKSFVVIEDDGEDKPTEMEGVTFFGHTPAKIAAHELAHLFGAHHQYANCIEGIPSEIEDVEASPCTVMFNDVGLVSLAFGALEGSVVRGYALQFLTP